MLGNFSYCNPTKLHFGPEALDALAGELAHYGKRVQLISRRLLHQEKRDLRPGGIHLKAQRKEIFEDPGVL